MTPWEGKERNCRKDRSAPVPNTRSTQPPLFANGAASAPRETGQHTHRRPDRGRTHTEGQLGRYSKQPNVTTRTRPGCEPVPEPQPAIVVPETGTAASGAGGRREPQTLWTRADIVKKERQQHMKGTNFTVKTIKRLCSG